MLFASTSPSVLVAALGTISSDIFTSAYGFLIVAVGIPLAFYIVKQVIALMPKSRAHK
jgi:hypothetical protein